jgi:hypothetical protein
MYLNRDIFVEMYLNNELDKLYRVDSFITEDKKSDKLLKLFRKGKLKKLKKRLKDISKSI